MEIRPFPTFLLGGLNPRNNLPQVPWLMNFHLTPSFQSPSPKDYSILLLDLNEFCTPITFTWISEIMNLCKQRTPKYSSLDHFSYIPSTQHLLFSTPISPIWHCHFYDKCMGTKMMFLFIFCQKLCDKELLQVLPGATLTSWRDASKSKWLRSKRLSERV